MDLSALNAWGREKQNPQYAVTATAGVYSFVAGCLIFQSVYELSFKNQFYCENKKFSYRLKFFNQSNHM